MTSSRIPENPDWNKLAQEALDLWQEHLASYTTDPVAKTDLARFMLPMSQMFAEWSTMMQNGLHGTPTGQKSGNAKNDSSPTAPSSKATYAAPAMGAEHMAQLADRVAELEQQLAAFEQQFAAATDEAGTTGKRPGTGSRSGKTSSGHH